MASMLIQIADAVVAGVNAATLSMPVTAKREYQPLFELEDMQNLHVTAVPKSVDVSRASRSQAVYDYKIDVAVQRKFAEDSAAEIDPLMQLVEEIADAFRFKALPGLPGAIWVKTEHPAIYAPEHMSELRQFTSVLTFTFREIR